VRAASFARFDAWAAAFDPPFAPQPRKTRWFSDAYRSAPVLHRSAEQLAAASICRCEERSMSLSVGSNSSNPFALIQSMWPHSSSTNGAQGQSDPLASLLSSLGQQYPAAQISGANSSSPTSPSASTPGSSSANTQFGPQTLQALLALQTDNSDPQALASQFANAVNDADPTSQSDASQGQRGHHHHHMGAGGSGGQNLLSLLSGASSSATSKTTTNPNGTSTTSITYADGSTVSMTTAASGTSGSDATTSSAGGANVTGGNMLERLIQMQAQLLAPAATQSVTA
jgi:hypothetical protein